MRPAIAPGRLWPAAALALLNACASPGGARAPLSLASSLQVRDAQTRRFEDAGRALALAAVTQGLQDAGFQIKTADSALGLVVASFSQTEGKEASTLVKTIFWHPYLLPFRGRLPKLRQEVVEVTATVTEADGTCRIRLNAHRTEMVSGKVHGAAAVEDPLFYQELFARIDKALFLEKEKV